MEPIIQWAFLVRRVKAAVLAVGTKTLEIFGTEIRGIDDSTN